MPTKKKSSATRGMRLDETTYKAILQATKTRQFSSPSAFMRSAIEKELRGSDSTFNESEQRIGSAGNAWASWDTSEHAWLGDRGPNLIGMIDDASDRIHARFVMSDSAEENVRLLWSDLEKYGRPVSCYTDKASLFQTALKIPRNLKPVPRDEREPLPPTQIGRALAELDILWIAAHSPQAKDYASHCTSSIRWGTTSPVTARFELHQSRFSAKKQNPQNFARGPAAFCFGACHVATVVGSAPGSATSPKVRFQLNPYPETQQDILLCAD